MVKIESPDTFFKLQSKFHTVPFSQSKGWYNHLKARGKDIVFYADCIPDSNIICWGVLEKVPLIEKRILRIEGEVYKEINEKVIRNFYSAFKESEFLGVEINNNVPYQIEYEIGIRRAGFVRPLGGFISPLSMEVDLTGELKFNQDWKRNLKKSFQNDLKFKEILTPTPEDIDAFVMLYNGMARYKSLIFNVSYRSIANLIESVDFRLFMVYDDENTPLSGRIVYVSRGHAYSIYAANSTRAREYSSAYFIYANILGLLKEEQCKVIDHGRIPPSDKGTDGLYVFKRGAGGRKIQYNGEWTYYKSRITELAVFFYKWLKLKKQRY